MKVVAAAGPPRSTSRAARPSATVNSQSLTQTARTRASSVNSPLFLLDLCEQICAKDDPIRAVRVVLQEGGSVNESRHLWCDRCGRRNCAAFRVRCQRAADGLYGW